MTILASTALAGGCGAATRGDGGPEPVTARDGGAVIATLGDSIVAGSPAWDPDESVRASFDDVDRDSQWQRWVEIEDELRNCGVWGERTDEIADRFEQCTKGADAVVIQGGINDIVQGRDIDDAARDLACVAERARRADLRIALVEVLPWNNGTEDSAAAIRGLNARIREIAEQGGVPVLPFHSVLEDPERPGRMPAELTVEGDHPNVAGYRMLGRQAWREPVAARAEFASGCPTG